MKKTVAYSVNVLQRAHLLMQVREQEIKARQNVSLFPDAVHIGMAEPALVTRPVEAEYLPSDRGPLSQRAFARGFDIWR